jgi:hypothetical protein
LLEKNQKNTTSPSRWRRIKKIQPVLPTMEELEEVKKSIFSGIFEKQDSFPTSLLEWNQKTSFWK